MNQATPLASTAQPKAPVAPALAPAISPVVSAPPATATAIVKPPAPTTAIVKPHVASVAAAPPATKPAQAMKAAPANGRISSEVTNQSSMKAIWNEHHQKGVSYERIEQNARFGLRRAKGMTAYRICRKYEKVSGTKRPKAARGRRPGKK